jgi:hypothetical protein
MENNQKYLPLIFILPIFFRWFIDPQPKSLAYIGIVLVFLVVILLFVYLEITMKKRIQNISRYNNRRFLYTTKFSLLYGLPISVCLAFILSQKVHILYSIIFIVLPLVILFGWVGFNDWNECQKKHLEMKYSSNQ